MELYLPNQFVEFHVFL